MKKGKIRITALFTVFLMCVTMIPSAVFAEGEHVHTMEYVEKVEATCQNSGMEAHYHCTDPECDKLFLDKDGTQETDGQDLIIPIKDHDWDDGVVEREASAAQPGLYKFTCKNCGATYTEEYEYIEPPETTPSAKKFSADGYKVQFKEKVGKKPQSFLDKAKVDHIWIKAGKKQIKVIWKVTDSMKILDGIIILRKTGKETLYKEVKRVSLKKNVDGYLKWDPKSSFTDKTAKKKNTPYSYIAVAYYDEGDTTYISHFSDWAAGQTTASKLKNAYKATISKKSVSLQYKGKATLKLKIKNAKKVYNSKNIRWYSDNKKVAKVNSKGVVTATGVGKTVIRGRLSSGYDFTSKVSVVGAFKPAEPKLKVDVASNTSITLIWNKVKYATSYDLYQSNDGVHWKSPVRVKATSKKVTGLSKGHRYTFYVVARNDNNGYTAVSKNSNVVNQKAVIKRRPTTVSGFPKSKSLTSGTPLILTLKISSPDSRKASLQMLNGKKWITQKTVTLPAGAGTTTVKLRFPDKWWGKTTSWRLVIPQDNTSEAYTSGTLTIKGLRVYQNPSKYIQIKDSINSHGYSYYVSKVLVNSTSTRTQHVEALINTANKYKGDTYVNGRAGAPGKGIDNAGLIIEACYGAGIDLWPISPVTRPADTIERIMNSKLQFITDKQPDAGSDDYKGVYRGDLIFFQTGKNKIGHVAIYLGLGKIIHASQVTGKVETTTLKTLLNKNGKYKYKVEGAYRLFVY